MNELALLHDLDGVFQALFSLLRMLEQSSVPQWLLSCIFTTWSETSVFYLGELERINKKNTIVSNDSMFIYAQVYCQECWRKELQVRKAFGDRNTVNVLYFAKKVEQSNCRTGSGAMCHRGQN